MGNILKNKINFKAVIKYVIYFALFFISFKAGIGGKIFPFIFGLFVALVWCNQNIILLSFALIISSYLSTFSLYTLLSSSIFSVLFSIIYFIHYKIKKPMRYLHLLIYSCICAAPKIFIEIYFLNANIYLCFIEFIFSLLYTFCCIKIFEAINVRGFCNRLTNLEVICLSFFIGACACGLMSFSFNGVDLIKFFATITLLVCGYVSNTSFTLLISGSIGIGTLLNSNNTIYTVVFLLYALAVCAFKTKNKYITIVALISMECICGLYFDFYLNFSILTVLPVLAACLCYILIPTKILDKFGNEFQESQASMTQQSVINRNREQLNYRLVELGDVFSEMNKVYRGMISGGLYGSDAKRLLLNELKIKNCKGCPSQGKCYRVMNDETIKALNIMVDCGFEKGRVNLLDVPTQFAGKCEKLNALVSSVNDLINQYKNYAGLVNNIDASKVLLAEQLQGVSEIMFDLSKEVNKGVYFERGKEKKIIDELTYNNIICSDALVFQDRDEILSVTISVRKNDSNKAGITRVISKVCGQNMDIVDESSSSRAGWQILTLKSAPKYDVIFGISSKTKTGSVKSGDAYSIVKISEGKYLFALCDGMGSGELAEKTSSTAIGLVENFYKAGFDKNIILSSVNKLLSLGKDDVFSALDLCVLDTRVGVGDFIKMGAPESFIKHKETTDVVKMGALPLGIVQSAEGKTKQIYFSSGDKIILMTDGVCDGFKSIEELQDFINNLSMNNPQTIADEIINRTLSLNKNIAKDDMSVIVAKIFER